MSCTRSFFRAHAWHLHFQTLATVTMCGRGCIRRLVLFRLLEHEEPPLQITKTRLTEALLSQVYNCVAKDGLK